MVSLSSRLNLFRLLLVTIALLTIFSCAGHLRREVSTEKKFLTEDKLWEIHKDVRFTYFHYSDSSIASGLLLRWQPDSIVIQGRGEAKPRVIPTSGLTRIETVTGNKIGTGLSLGIVAAAAYFAIVRGWELSGITFLSAIGKLLVPPAIIVTGIGIGSSRENREVFYLPPGFIFDYEAVKHYHQTGN